MADILVRKISDETKSLLRRRARRRGKSLEADLRETLDQLARDEAASPEEAEPLGSWLHRISRPGVEVDDVLRSLRNAPMRPVSFD